MLRGVTCCATVRSLLRRFTIFGDDCLKVRTLGLEFPNPVGVAAGFDKDGRSFEGLGTLGFGFVEVGTVTARPQPGNPRPRVFRLPQDRALVNRMGFPNPGAGVVAKRLLCRSGATIVGVNVGKTKAVRAGDVVDDYCASVAALAPVADYLVINVSSPNTPGLRDFQTVDRLTALVHGARAVLAHQGKSVPLLVKIGPDLPDDAIDAVAEMALALELDGIIAVNTTDDTTTLSSRPQFVRVPNFGGISGHPLKKRAIDVLHRLYARVGSAVVLVSVGGIATPEDAFERILAGATLVQAHTGFVYGGPLWPRRMNRGLMQLVRASGMASVQQLVGAGKSATATEGQLNAHAPASARPFT